MLHLRPNEGRRCGSQADPNNTATSEELILVESTYPLT